VAVVGGSGADLATVGSVLSHGSRQARARQAGGFWRGSESIVLGFWMAVALGLYL
jgi:hypothetical protein